MWQEGGLRLPHGHSLLTAGADTMHKPAIRGRGRIAAHGLTTAAKSPLFTASASFTNAIAVSLQPFCTALESSLSFLASTSSMSITSCLILPCKPRQSTCAMPAGCGVTTPAAEGRRTAQHRQRPFAELLATELLLRPQTLCGIDLGVWNALVRLFFRSEQVRSARAPLCERQTGYPDGQQHQVTGTHPCLLFNAPPCVSNGSVCRFGFVGPLPRFPKGI